MPVAGALPGGAQAVADLFGVPVSQGTVAAMTSAAADGLGVFTARVRAGLRAAPLLHVDETGLRVDGRTHWVHSTSTDSLSLITVHPRRGRAGIDAHGVLPDYGGIAVHDAWAPYDCYRTATRALCSAHLLRDLQQVIDSCPQPGDAAWARQGIDALLELKRLVEQATDGQNIDPAR